MVVRSIDNRNSIPGMTRLSALLLSLLTVAGLSACGGEGYADSVPGKCLIAAGYETEDGRTFLKGDSAVTLAQFTGSVQPVTEQDLRDYMAVGCL